MGEQEYSLRHLIGLCSFAVTVMIHILSLSFPESYVGALASTSFANGTATFQSRNITAIQWGSHISCYSFDNNQHDTSGDLCQKTRTPFIFNTTDLHGNTTSALIDTSSGTALARSVFDYGSLFFTGVSIVFAGTHHSFQPHGSYSSGLSGVSNIITLCLEILLYFQVKNQANVNVKIGKTTSAQLGMGLIAIRLTLLLISALFVHYGHGRNREIAQQVSRGEKMFMKDIESDNNAFDRADDNNDSS